MYNPNHFSVSDRSKLLNFIRKYPFGTVFSSYEGNPFTSHIPFIVDDTKNELLGHFALENSHWKYIEGKDVLIEFMGPGHYISPVWYERDSMVPTWNYALVQVRGRFSIIREEKERIEVLDRIVDSFESSSGEGWVPDWSDKVLAKMSEMIVVFKISIESMTGKWKMSQNHPVENRKKVVGHLRDLHEYEADKVADMMSEFFH